MQLPFSVGELMTLVGMAVGAIGWLIRLEGEVRALKSTTADLQHADKNHAQSAIAIAEMRVELRLLRESVQDLKALLLRASDAEPAARPGAAGALLSHRRPT